jgi:quinol monooxygenase YgiN
MRGARPRRAALALRPGRPGRDGEAAPSDRPVAEGGGAPSGRLARARSLCKDGPMIIIAGRLYVDPQRRDEYLAATADVAPKARSFRGCLDFVQAADPVEPDRINVYERWSSDDDVAAFRASGGTSSALPEIRKFDVKKYRIASTEAP